MSYIWKNPCFFSWHNNSSVPFIWSLLLFFLVCGHFFLLSMPNEKKIPQTLGKRVVSSQNSSNIVSICARIQSPFVFFNSERKDLRHSVLLLMCLQRKKKARVVLQKPELILVALIRHTHTTTKHSSRFFLYLIPLGKVSRITKL